MYTSSRTLFTNREALINDAVNEETVCLESRGHEMESMNLL